MKYVISLGGSLIAPKTGLDIKFLKKFRALILEQVRAGHRFLIISGGGRTARDYIQAADKVIKVSNEDKDWMGIHSTRLNAHLLRTIFYDIAEPKIIKHPDDDIEFKKPVVVAGGWKPGHSTDFVAVTLAERYKIKTVINLSNIDYVYDKDPRKHKDAKKITDIAWPVFRTLVGDTWDPGLNAPFDPIASRRCHELGMTAVIMDGNDISNLRKYFRNEKFKGTTIR